MSLPSCTDFVGYTYLDPSAGLSARGDSLEKLSQGSFPAQTVRLPFGQTPWTVFPPEKIRSNALPEIPTWVEHYGPQPPSGTLWGQWRVEPLLQGRFHPSYPDDLQVVVHEGGPRTSSTRPELIWVRVLAGQNGQYQGTLLNQPHGLSSLSQGSIITFIMPSKGPQPLRATELYLKERSDWVITPCDKCGLTELFDPPSVLIPATFQIPEGSTLEMFTTFCGMCGGTMHVRHHTVSEPS